MTGLRVIESGHPEMGSTVSKTQRVLAIAAGGLVIFLVISGAVWNGLSVDVIQRLCNDILARPGGPMTFRFVLQPTMAVIAAWNDGVKDARAGRSTFFWMGGSRSTSRLERMRTGLVATARIILLGLIMDTIYQVVVLKEFFPAEAAIVAVILAYVPYVLLRGPLSRVASWRVHKTTGGSA